MTKKKNILIVGVILIIIFGLYNLFWWLSVMHTYKPYVKAVPKNKYGVYVKYDEKEEITYNVKLPDYLHFTGNLGVSDQNNIVIIIWPSIFNQSFQYGVRVQDDTEAYEIYVDENLEPVSGDELEKEMINRNYKEIKKLYDSAMEIWFHKKV